MKIPRDCPYCDDSMCRFCVEHQAAVDRGRWPQHDDGSPYPYPGYANLTSVIRDELKRQTADKKPAYVIIIQGDHPDDFAALGSSSGDIGRPLLTDMCLRAASLWNSHVKESADSGIFEAEKTVHEWKEQS